MRAEVDTLINLSIMLAGFLALAIWWMVKHGSSRSRISARARQAAFDQQDENALAVLEDEHAGGTGRLGGLSRRLAAFGDKMPLFDAKTRAKLQGTVLRAGMRSRHAVSMVLAIKFSFGVMVAVATIMMGSNLPLVGSFPAARGVAMLGAFMVGMILPEYVLMWIGARRMKAISGYLPDALDLLVICTNAGNSFVLSLRRVADEMASICPPLAEEFALTADELKLSGDTSTALHALGKRVDLPSIKALIGTLIQSMRYGTPITQALRTLSRTERLAHVVSLEEKAAKLAPKMVLPMLVFILPAVVVISAGPAVIQLLAYLNPS
ncbi:type II secretion system F family protein [Robbsia sp. KACC 23696]|uniref:type II secretion system F family protein n=1 Tax=Robbsia sp. KACC 23696 TaxID=3149231 RepID=UPI00325C2AF2